MSVHDIAFEDVVLALTRGVKLRVRKERERTYKLEHAVALCAAARAAGMAHPAPTRLLPTERLPVVVVDSFVPSVYHLCAVYLAVGISDEDWGRLLPWCPRMSLPPRPTPDERQQVAAPTTFVPWCVDVGRALGILEPTLRRLDREFIRGRMVRVANAIGRHQTTAWAEVGPFVYEYGHGVFWRLGDGNDIVLFSAGGAPTPAMDSAGVRACEWTTANLPTTPWRVHRYNLFDDDCVHTYGGWAHNVLTMIILSVAVPKTVDEVDQLGRTLRENPCRVREAVGGVYTALRCLCNVSPRAVEMTKLALDVSYPDHGVLYNASDLTTENLRLAWAKAWERAFEYVASARNHMFATVGVPVDSHNCIEERIVAKATETRSLTE